MDVTICKDNQKDEQGSLCFIFYTFVISIMEIEALISSYSLQGIYISLNSDMYCTLFVIINSISNSNKNKHLCITKIDCMDSWY